MMQLKSFIGGIVLLALIVSLGIPLSVNLIEVPYILYIVRHLPDIVLVILGFTLYFILEGLRKIDTTNTLLILSLSSVFGMILAALFLHERTSILQIIAVGIMIFGIYLIKQFNIQNSTKIHAETASHI
jgi:drug/metabolite transporter (DMT)-like permease